MALRRIKARTLVFAIKSDILFPPEEQAFLVENIPDAGYQLIESIYGHDGFLLEFDAIQEAIGRFLPLPEVPSILFKTAPGELTRKKIV